ncbi:L-alanine-DL-glutamate epimerase-like enolase superfamily enzyme [Kitasatospora herbaricolor]|uniref:enolase C-terminal domain-like protein n=1 Tax=Kitasatospora herbaricolor TaxID=68217 RepID=UPI0017480273|nr:enolase C-terminal domain-like protein [Kitasatospora herbaricolor]MDQ0306598.1 L-alanine-DL-glutamate epimerase-like enolase superfamily enzyme [Kitasatospora herbaricolor]
MRMETRTVRLRLAEPLRISRSVTAARDAVVVTLRQDGLSGSGEVVSSHYLGLPTALIVRQFRSVRARIEAMTGPEAAVEQLGNGTALLDTLAPGVAAALEAALLDLAGRRAGQPAHRLLGTAAAPAAATARTIGITAPARAAALATRLAAAGFTVLKVKAGSADPAEDLARVEAVRAAAPQARLLLDPNGAWTAARAGELLPRFAALGVSAVEQPIAPGDHRALAALAADSPLPVIADEDAAGHRDAVRLAGRVHGVNVKLAKCGGVFAALRICEALRGSGTRVMLGCLTASSLGIAPAVHLVDRAHWVDLDGHLLLAHDPWQGIGGADGTVRAAGRAGLGVRPRAQARA